MTIIFQKHHLNRFHPLSNISNAQNIITLPLLKVLSNFYKLFKKTTLNILKELNFFATLRTVYWLDLK